MRDTILIVDDEADIVSTLEDYFIYNDYNVITAANGKDAINKAGKQPDLILLDIMMPDMDGLEICSKIRSNVDCPIIFLTAKTQETDIVRGLGLGGDDYITKPFGTNELRARVNAHIRRDTREKKHSVCISGVVFQPKAKEVTVNM